ncbi:MAG: VOC family protein [Candidatus Eisenbacteria bacterium]
MPNVSTCLWFDHHALEAARFYTSLFPNSHVGEVTHYLERGPMPAGHVLTVTFVLDGVEYLALNGGPIYPHTPAMSMVAYCDTQDEIDRLWDGLLAGGGAPVQCGWLTDRFGVSWQIVPRPMMEMLKGTDPAASQRAWEAMMAMVKLDLAAIRRAYDGV